MILRNKGTLLRGNYHVLVVNNHSVLWTNPPKKSGIGQTRSPFVRNKNFNKWKPTTNHYITMMLSDDRDNNNWTKCTWHVGPNNGTVQCTCFLGPLCSCLPYPLVGDGVAWLREHLTGKKKILSVCSFEHFLMCSLYVKKK